MDYQGSPENGFYYKCDGGWGVKQASWPTSCFVLETVLQLLCGKYITEVQEWEQGAVRTHAGSKAYYSPTQKRTKIYKFLKNRFEKCLKFYHEPCIFYSNIQRCIK